MANPNLEILLTAVKNLDYLVNELVFVGGCTTGLFITDEGAGEVRETKDVDTIVEATSYVQYIRFSEKLQKVGFRIDTSEGAPTCRWIKGDTILDVMPLDEDTLGFTNIWYQPAMETANEFQIQPDLNIRVVTPPFFCATKLEAFEGRGNGDYLGSHDLEDLITVVDGRVELIDEIDQAPEKVRLFITAKIRGLLENRQFLNALPGHLNDSVEGRIGIVLNRLAKIAKIK